MVHFPPASTRIHAARSKLIFSASHCTHSGRIFLCCFCSAGHQGCTWRSRRAPSNWRRHLTLLVSAMSSHSFRDSVTGAIVTGELWSPRQEETVQAPRSSSSALDALAGAPAGATIELARALTSTIDATEGSLAKVLRDLQVADANVGLSPQEASKRLAEAGPNELSGDEVRDTLMEVVACWHVPHPSCRQCRCGSWCWCNS